jgi:hypothetical protein
MLALSGLATLLALIRPMIDLSKQNERYATLFATHQQNFFRLRRVCATLQDIKEITPEMRAEMDAVYRVNHNLAALEEPVPNRSMLLRFMDEVETEIPALRLYWPSEQFLILSMR